MKKENWIKVSDRLPTENKSVKTKIDTDGIIRNEGYLVRKGTLWWLPDEAIYAYFPPTHWLDE